MIHDFSKQFFTVVQIIINSQKGMFDLKEQLLTFCLTLREQNKNLSYFSFIYLARMPIMIIKNILFHNKWLNVIIKVYNVKKLCFMLKH